MNIGSLLLKHNLNVMDVEKNVCDSLLNIILGWISPKTQTMQKRFSRHENQTKIIFIYPRRGSRFYVDLEECRQFCKLIKLVKFSNGFASNLTKNITDNDNKIASLKSHDHHVIIHKLLLLRIQPFLKKTIVTTILDNCHNS